MNPEDYVNFTPEEEELLELEEMGDGPNLGTIREG